MIFCGDTFLSTKDGSNPFREISSTFQERCVCLNMEVSLHGESKNNKMVSLTINKNNLSVLHKNIRFVSVVNNHCMDGGKPTELVHELNRLGKIVIGPKNPSKVSTNLYGLNIDIICAYIHLPRFSVDYFGNVSNSVVEFICESSAHRKIVMLHWGYEQIDVPAPFQRELAHRLVDAGADIIIGHHPHVAQGWEIYKEKYIYYSLGNFNFWQSSTATTEVNRKGFMVVYDILDGKSSQIVYRINDNYQPVILEGKDADEYRIKLNELSCMLCNIGEAEWFNKKYYEWYRTQIEIWRRYTSKSKSVIVLLKFIAWLLLPMQIKYYWLFVRFRLFESDKRISS